MSLKIPGLRITVVAIDAPPYIFYDGSDPLEAIQVIVAHREARTWIQVFYDGKFIGEVMV